MKFKLITLANYRRTTIHYTHYTILSRRTLYFLSSFGIPLPIQISSHHNHDFAGYAKTKGQRPSTAQWGEENKLSGQSYIALFSD